MKFFLLFVLVLSAFAQDTRTVAEPSIPPSCTTLKARLTAAHGALGVADENKPDTMRIQQALDQCPQGQSVTLAADGSANAFLSGPIQLRAGVTLVVGANAVLVGSRNPTDYEISPGSCGVVNDKGRGCTPLISVDHVANAGVMGDGVIDGRGGATLVGKTVSWWDLAQEAKVRNLNQSVPRILVANHADNFTLYRITLRNSPNFHVSYSGGDGFTAWGVIIDSPKTARNTDGIDPGNCTNVTITHCFIHAGDDNVAIKAGGAGPTSHITVAHNHFYTGHGMSIGSETDGGLTAVRITDLSIDGADNGIRIKSNSSRGGLVRGVVYEDVCIQNTKNPIFMDSNYSFYGTARDKLPQFTDITLRNVRVLTPGKITLDGYDPSHRLGMTFNNVIFDMPEKTPVTATHANLTFGPGPVNFMASGDDVDVTGSPGKGLPNTCAGKFVSMPEHR